MKQLRWDVAVMPPTVWYGSSYTRELYLEQENMEFLRRVAIGSRAQCDRVLLFRLGRVSYAHG